MPSIAQLEYVLAVREVGHFGRAAKQCGVAQPTLSMQIRKAEEELGVTLFDRRRKPVVPTPAGHAFIERAQKVVEAHDELLRLAHEERGALTGEFAVGIIPTLAPFVLPWFLARFASDYPAIELSIFERPTDELITEIANHRIDAAILATPLHESFIQERALFYDPFYLYAHADESVLDADHVEVEDLDPRKLWLLEDGHCMRTQVINFCGVRERSHLGSVSFAGGSFETLRRLIDSSEGYTLVPETYARLLPRSSRQRNVRPFETRTPVREVSLVHHKRSWKEDVLDALEHTVRAATPRALRQVASDGEVISVRAQ